MDFSIDSEQKALRDAVRELASRHAPQHGQGDAPVGPATHDADTWSALAEVGALGLPYPEDAGGFGASAVEVAVVASELGRAGVLTAYAESLVAGSLLAQAGHELLGDLTEGSALVVPALAEPGRAWSLASSSVQAEDSTLTGRKGPVPYADAASHVIVPATEDGALALYLVESPTVENGHVVLDSTKATRLLDASATAGALAQAVNLGTVALCAEALGTMDAATTMTVEYLKTRKQFGVPLMTFQTLTQRAADMYVSLELARSTVQFAAMAIADNPEDSATVSRTKVVTGQSGRHIGQEAIQLHGGIGMTAEYAVGHLTTRLTAIERTYGDTRQHLAALAAGLSDHGQVDVLA
ncbi:acyl-CoA/acyl-ACP dehydrogenase [Luteipulveratus sp. YIM 133132]|uniref:Acyl-CoA/acyl-ACP dehydrogenase n=1 Tax=Luteipulveratus flavus TaxID=3031728 RepID=A0ABT6C5U9_9MICO|nr:MULTISPECIES: acyl-CoA dehydrogenase family protein [unclassified Luteipulveratus]MDE9364101.1 acyl-CoA/acyl-ACP dehydrogenase [Luteipulveratus sp. YIM 133132]MDF8264319.1 acyl-CoA/acyl-ACP dehydrogenase [Luteipulveratus sp. YIM 133296]